MTWDIFVEIKGISEQLTGIQWEHDIIGKSWGRMGFERDLMGFI
jgi:hypothetical protein